MLFVTPGLGDLSPQNQSIASVAAAGASATTGILVSLGTLGGPVGAVIAGLIGVGMQIAKLFGGCGQTCVETSNWANQTEPILQLNLQHYLSAPVHYASLQAAAVNNFKTAWNALAQACSNPSLGNAGKNCIGDRESSGCTWRAQPGGWSQAADGSWSYVYAGPAGKSNQGECWNWFVGYLDPIVNDPTVVPDPSPAAASAAGLLQDVGINPASTIAGVPLSDLAFPVAMILAALIFL